MILTSNSKDGFYLSLDKIGLRERIHKDNSVLIKINLARPAGAEHPRTDSAILSDVIQYIYLNGGTCAVAESANGYLRKNLEQAGLHEIISSYNVKVIDLDLEEAEPVSAGGEDHYIPSCFKNYGVRIAIPAASKRPEMIFSNNVKLFVGAVPRRMYQMDNKIVDWRPRVHIDLHKSVANIFRAIQSYSPFHCFINGGLAMAESIGEFRFNEIFVGNDGVELDFYILEKYFDGFAIPEYLKLI